MRINIWHFLANQQKLVATKQKFPLVDRKDPYPGGSTTDIKTALKNLTESFYSLPVNSVSTGFS